MGNGEGAAAAPPPPGPGAVLWEWRHERPTRGGTFAYSRVVRRGPRGRPDRDYTSAFVRDDAPDALKRMMGVRPDVAAAE